MFWSKIKIFKTTYSTQEDVRVATKFFNLQQSALHRGLEFNLTLEDVRLLLKQEFCFYTGVKLSDSVKDGMPTPSTHRTIDRVDNSKGYVQGNVVAASWDINIKKGNLTLQEIEIIYNKTHDTFRKRIARNNMDRLRSFFSVSN